MIKELSLINSRLDGRYDIKELLGRGSYAEIYLANDIVAAPTSPHKQIVIKALNVFMQNDLDTDLERTLVENFQNEAIALDRVRHPNILNRLGHGTARDLRGTVFHYLVLEYLSGGDLAKACREKTLTFQQSFGYIEQVCAGLAHAHQSGVIHRDIKPQNLLLTSDCETVKIADFGVARFSASDSPITRVGTNVYAPPEHSPIFSEGNESPAVAELTPAADVYSLAKTAYVLFTGESPRFFANQPISELPFACRQEQWAHDLLSVLTKATQNSPKDRQADIYDFWRDFSKLKVYAVAGDDSETQTHVGSRTTNTPKAHVARGYTPLAPQKPAFNTSRELKLDKNQVLKNPAIVTNVVVNHAPFTEQKSPASTLSSTLNRIPVAGAVQSPPVNGLGRIALETPRRKSRPIRSLAILLVFFAIFGTVLYATHSYLRDLGLLPEIRNPFSKPTGVATSDVNLRIAGDPSGQIIGLVPKNSRVRVVNSKDNWYEVDIVEYGRPKESATDADHGWVNKRYIDLAN